MLSIYNVSSGEVLEGVPPPAGTVKKERALNSRHCCGISAGFSCEKETLVLGVLEESRSPQKYEGAGFGGSLSLYSLGAALRSGTKLSGCAWSGD